MPKIKLLSTRKIPKSGNWKKSEYLDSAFRCKNQECQLLFSSKKSLLSHIAQSQDPNCMIATSSNSSNADDTSTSVGDGQTGMQDVEMTAHSEGDF